MTVVNDVAPIVQDIYPLYLKVYERSKLQFEKLTERYFCGLGRLMPEKARFFVWRQGKTIVAFMSCLVEGDELCAEYIGLDSRFDWPDIKIVYGYLGEGYGVVGDLEREAIRLMARTEGIILDPVYAGRAFGALVDLIRKNVFRRDERVLFWHTGGLPTLFARPVE